MRHRRIARLAAAFSLVTQVGAALGEDEPPAAALLEFLAEWEDEQGEWQDPMQYDDPGWQVLDEETGRNDE